MENKKFAFLFGSGISIAAKMPTTFELSNLIMEGKNVKHETDGRYSIREEHNPMLDYMYVSQIIELLKIINNKIDLFHYDIGDVKDVNYEEIYFVLNEIENALLGEVENPCLSLCVDEIFNQIKPFLISRDKHVPHITFQKIITESLQYIKDLVHFYLSDKERSISYLDFLKKFYLDKSYSKLLIFTLNHDTLLEKFFNLNSVKFIDGFDKPDSQNIRYWNPKLFDKNKNKVELFKLHGSINWYRLRRNGGTWFDEKVGILNGDIHRTKREDGSYQFAPDNKPLILVGSFNKLKEYLSGVFLYLHLQLYTKLPLCNTLIVSGYGFQDKGINTRIIEWVYSEQGKKILIIDPDVYDLKRRSNGAIRNKWNDWVERGILKTMNNWIEYVSYEDIQNALHSEETDS